jgi:hypothetical protein
MVFKNYDRSNPARASLPPPPIPLSFSSYNRRDDRRKSGIKLKLRVEPNNAQNLSEYYFFMKYLTPTDTDPETYCDFVIDLRKVIEGQGIQGGPGRYRLARDLLQGRHLFDFNSFAQEMGAETIAHFDECIRRLGMQIFPKQSKTRQIFAMRNAVKPDGISIRDFFGRIKDVAMKFEQIEPLQLTEDDYKDIIVRAMPEHYISRMFEGGFDPDDHDLLETLNRLERFETADLVGGRRPRNRSIQNERKPRRLHKRNRGFQKNHSYKFNNYNRPQFRHTPSFQNRTYRRTGDNNRHNGRFQAQRRFKSTAGNNRPNFYNRGGGSNSNNNNFRRNDRHHQNGRFRGNQPNNRGQGRNRQWNRREQEANQLDVVEQVSASSDVSL